ncbi:FAD binding domain in molybdopterin dehydrogenase [Acetobacteraceae bacterium AT-5844]|nr:FAD binding domain in molybdopterin dehydrogenase [Acetobacteraceae bacterium AT-5844]
MRDFAYHRAATLDEARALIVNSGSAILAGGTTLLDLAKCQVARPAQVVDITRLPGLGDIRADAEALHLGALVRMAQAAGDPAVRAACPAVAEALALSASAQIRNMATLGGNLLQRTRCAYFRDPASYPDCNKREPGSGCAAQGGVTRGHALLGTSEACIATHPGDLAVTLVAFDAVVEIGTRWMRAVDFFLTPGDRPDREFALDPGEMVTALCIPASEAARRSTYLKLRDRASYEFASLSVAAGLERAADGTISALHLALGGIATVPWRLHAVEEALIGQQPTSGAVREASLLAIQGAEAREDNRHKLDLAPRLVQRAIEQLLGEVA